MSTEHELEISETPNAELDEDVQDASHLVAGGVVSGVFMVLAFEVDILEVQLALFALAAAVAIVLLMKATNYQRP